MCADACFHQRHRLVMFSRSQTNTHWRWCFVAVLSPELVQRLAKFRGDDHPVISLYLNIDGREKIRTEDYVLQLESLIKDALADQASGEAAGILERIRDYVADEFERENNRGLAI